MPSLLWLCLAVLLHKCAVVRGHVEMKEPPPRHSQFSKFYMDNDDVDYNMKSPLGPIVGYPCRNFKAGPVQGTMIAGHPFRVQFDGVATHLGGDCQFAVSYDNGTTFAVIWDKVASCFLDTVNGSYDVPVPDTIPASKKATFAWTWINALGSREYYMNCADVRIENYGRQVPLTAHELLVVNLPGKQTLSPKSGREEDRLPAMLQQRSFVTVGKDTDLEPDEQGDGHSAKPAGGSDDAQADGEADPVANRASSGKGDDDVSLPDEITSYVYTTRTIVEDGADGDEANPDDGFTYNDVDDYKSRRKSSNGLTVLSDETDISEYLGSFKKLPGGPITSIPFNMDDTLPLATHHLTSDDNLDQWPSSSVSALPGSAEIGSESSHSAATLDLGLALPALETGAVSMRGASLGFPGGAPLAAGADMVTQFKTITISNKPVLQIVVSSNRTAVPESLTLSVSA